MKALKILFLIIWAIPAFICYGLSWSFWGISWLLGAIAALWFYVKGDKTAFKKTVK